MEEVRRVEEYLATHKGHVNIFPAALPPSVSDRTYNERSEAHRQEYLDWLTGQYPLVTFRLVTSQGSNTLAAFVTSYLITRWHARELTRGEILRRLLALNEEIGPLRKLKTAWLEFKAARRKLKGMRI